MHLNKFKNFVLPALLSVFLFCIFSFKTSAIKNPAVLPDETAYINLIGKISKTGTFDAAQYPPLYPFLASLGYINEDILTSYSNIRVINLIIFSLTLLPLFFLAKAIVKLPTSQISLLTMTLMLLPWSSFLTPVWAEPLYFLVFNCTVLLVLKSFQSRRTGYFLTTGLLLGLLFLTKQAGIILAVGFTITQFFDFLISSEKKRIVKHILVSLVPFISIVFLYKYLSYSANGSPGIGYSNVVNAMTTRFFSLLTKYDFYQSFLHQVSYVTTATFFVFFAGMIFLLLQFKSLEHFKKLFLFFISITLLGFMGFIAVFNNTVDISYNDTNQPLLGYGRYLVALLPSVIILGIFGLELFLQKTVNRKPMIAVFIVLFLLLGQFTPLHSAFASGIFGNPDITYLCQLFNQDFPPWDRSIIENNLGGLPWTLAFALSLFAVIFLMIHRKMISIALIIFFALGVYTGHKNQSYARSMAGFLEDENNVYKKLIELKIDKEQIYILEGYNPGIYIAQFWYGFYDFAGWVKNSQISKSEVSEKSIKFQSLQGKYIMMGNNDFKELPAVIEMNGTRVIKINSFD